MTPYNTIIEDFEFLEDWDDRYKYLIDLGRTLPPYPEEDRDEEHRVRGCASQVWLTHRSEADGRLTLYADSDAHIVRGLIGVVLSLYSGRTATEIAALDSDAALAPLDLGDHITPQRANGFAAMLAKVKSLAESRCNG